MKGTSSSIINANQAKQKMNPKLLIIHTIVMPEGNKPFIGKFTDILMLALTHKGRIRSEKEFRKLLNNSGFEIANVIRSHDPVNLSIIEAILSSSFHLHNNNMVVSLQHHRH